MMHFLKNHPFAVDAHFQDSLVLTYALPPDQIKPLIPECLELDTFQDQWAFIAIALVRTKELRPHYFPRFLGSNFTLIGYRVFVKYTTKQGKRLRGLYILKSDTDKKSMEYLGSLFTQYRYDTIDIQYQRLDTIIDVHSQLADLNIKVEINTASTSLPQHSPFTSWKEARRFAGPLPFTFSYHSEKREVLIVQGDREYWTPQPVEVLAHEVGFMKQPRYHGAILASAFIIENIPYHWQKGRIEQWGPN